MLRFTLLGLVALIVCVVFFVSSTNKVKTQKVDRVTAVEQFMNE
jgi:hypothetical protein